MHNLEGLDFVIWRVRTRQASDFPSYDVTSLKTDQPRLMMSLVGKIEIAVL